MAAAREILTFQLGHFSNFVGAHWWNLQESTFIYDVNESSKVEVLHDILFRQGCTRSGEVTYTPRLISVDLKGSLSTFSNQETSTVHVTTDLSWDGQIEFHNNLSGSESTLPQPSDTEPSSQNNLEERVKVWSDFLRPSLHERSVYLLPDYQHENSTDPFDLYPLGQNWWSTGDKREDIENLIRIFAEECDYLQGFHLLLDADNAFGGLTDRVLQHLSDEYSGKTTVAFPVLPTSSGLDLQHKTERLVNYGLVVESLVENASMFSPIGLDEGWTSGNRRNFKHLNFRPELPYHASAILATALDTVTLATRQKTGTVMTLNDLTHSLVRLGRKAVGLSCALPFPTAVDKVPTDLVTHLVPLTPCVDSFGSFWTQSLVWRGLSDPSAFQPVVDDWCRRNWDRSVTANTLFRQECPATFPFPQLFSSPGVASFPAVAGLHSSPLLGSRSVQQLHDEINRISVKKLHRFLISGLEEDDLLANRNSLADFSRCYISEP